MGWKTKADDLFDKYGREWSMMARELESDLPDLSHHERKEKIRTYIRGTKKFKEQKQADFEKSSIQYNSDGSIISQKFICLRDGDELTPSKILEAHGLKPEKWQVVSYKNNMWNTQVRGGSKQISYQSKLTAKPISNGLDLSEISDFFDKMERKKFTAPAVKKRDGSLMVEVNIADLHLGKLAWHGETLENYDCKIAERVYYEMLAEIVGKIRNKPIEYITFVWTNDFFNADTIQNTTTGLTPQDCDVRWQKMFNFGVEMLVRGIEMLAEIAPVKTFYTPSNHDEVNGYHAMKYLEAWFRNVDGIEINIDAFPRKYQLYGNTLIGYCHGNKENSTSSKEKASRLASCMPIEAPDLWGKAKFREFHTAHLHSEHMIQEINGVIVRRVSSPTAADVYHTTHGFVGAVRKAQTFIYDKQRGLLETINTPVL